MYIINPEPFTIPAYRISPFRTEDVSGNNFLSDDDSIDNYFAERFKEKKYVYTEDGRSGIDFAIKHYKLSENDVVTILTTTSNFYIAKCVTDKISETCRWSREIEPETKLILVNHEFGFPYPNLTALKKYGVPIVEDCAHTFFTQNEDKTVGQVGDFVVYSFPKMFPLQIGGLLVCNTNDKIEMKSEVGAESLRYMKNVLSHYIKDRATTIKKRLSNYSYLKNKFETLGLVERFDLKEGTVPGAFMFKCEDGSVDFPELKKFCNYHGIQSSVFYGEEAYFIPVHQSLCNEDLDYFYEVVKSFLKK